MLQTILVVAGTCSCRRPRFVVDADAAMIIVIRTGTPSARTPAWTTRSRATGIHRCVRGAAPWRRPRTPPSWPSPARRRPWPRRCCTPRRCPRATGATDGRLHHPRIRRRRSSSSSGASSSRRRRRLRRGRRAARRRWVQHGSHRARTTGASSASCARSPLSCPPASPSLLTPVLSLSLLYIRILSLDLFLSLGRRRRDLDAY
ncbi:hypothetical protein PVAP13_6NG034383 [Panicum virgatum]|uniref:Uncharacterized protein n=1 Tax=Panicum virgatum TaxID=38727 RepID=A0A8T0QUB2_PANVG|nr:hypothetical protein PVAP13_6NG034383 [Panicum virgatum]